MLHRLSLGRYRSTVRRPARLTCFRSSYCKAFVGGSNIAFHHACHVFNGTLFGGKNVPRMGNNGSIRLTKQPLRTPRCTACRGRRSGGFRVREGGGPEMSR